MDAAGPDHLFAYAAPATLALGDKGKMAVRGFQPSSFEMRWTVPVPIPSDLATLKAQRKQGGGKGVGIANGGRFRRRRLPKFLNENNAPVAVTNGGMDQTGRR